LLLAPHFLRLPQLHQHVFQQHLITWLLIAQARYATEHEQFIFLAFFGVHVESMGVMLDAFCQAWLTAFVGEARQDL
jgi:hypothetical protein